MILFERLRSYGQIDDHFLAADRKTQGDFDRLTAYAVVEESFARAGAVCKFRDRFAVKSPGLLEDILARLAVGLGTNPVQELF